MVRSLERLSEVVGEVCLSCAVNAIDGDDCAGLAVVVQDLGGEFVEHVILLRLPGHGPSLGLST